MKLQVAICKHYYDTYLYLFIHSINIVIMFTNRYWEFNANAIIKGVSKTCPKYKFASKLDNWKIADTNSNQRLISLSQSILFSYAQFCKQGDSKCLF